MPKSNHMAVLIIAAGLIYTHVTAHAQSQRDALRDSDGNRYAVRVMPDQKLWMIDNLNLNIPGSYCYDDQEQNCARYGRLYTWNLATEGCSKLGKGWRLPTNEEWRLMAKPYGGVLDDSDNNGKKAYQALIIGGSAKFNAALGGNREPNGKYERKDADGFYRTATEIGVNTAWFYNLAKGGQLLNHHEGEKDRATSVRCIRD